MLYTTTYHSHLGSSSVWQLEEAARTRPQCGSHAGPPPTKTTRLYSAL